MAAPPRHTSKVTHLHIFAILALSECASASPCTRLQPSNPLLSRRNAVISDTGGIVQVFDPTTQSPVPQFPASDGGGSGFSPPAIAWIILAFVIGVPLAVAGIRGWRLTTASAIGLSIAACSWVAFVNTVSGSGLPDLVLTIIVLGFFAGGFALGLFEVGRIAGIVLLGIVGGASLATRVIIMRAGLLTSSFPGNWAMVGALGLAGGILPIYKQRAGILFGSASTGTFLAVLGADLCINQQAGMSRGLRFLFDRNSSHLADLFAKGYHPPISTVVIIACSIPLIPALSYAQHKVFRHPFSRKPVEPDEIRGSIYSTDIKPSQILVKAPGRFSM
ncbi:hypothetical protein JAAARDRAFT_36553 [Jaapia argillacea MUCL 33604]|uniref:TM7S3/TM198-like domain-containing protein n=1 Tax=Jaapia argillacea MUCL 33604 TaxID=933084 RepID=A0A067PNL3_9AGAM|nr:hypothetical protein JAAARDRAFT_36553 [Jaapia argillacea MUCL 33604]